MHERKPAFLYSVDLEDVRAMIPDGFRYRDGVPGAVRKYLDFLERSQSHCTFFTVGDVARRHPEIIGELVARGHEIACHTSNHIPLDRRDDKDFREDLLRNLDDLRRAGAREICGFRAPIASLTERTAWAYDALAELGFRYSSSVLPAASPLYGWPGFPRQPHRTQSGVWEIPLSIVGLPGLGMPFVGGVYLRVLPFALVVRLFRREIRGGRPVVGYGHPYDVDTEQEYLMHPELRDSRLRNWLMYRNRSEVIPRLEKLLALGLPILPYADYVETELDRGVDEPG